MAAPQRTKIQIGQINRPDGSISSSFQQAPSSSSSSLSSSALDPSQILSIDKDNIFAQKSLYDLCDSRFTQKFGVKKKRKSKNNNINNHDNEESKQGQGGSISENGNLSNTMTTARNGRNNSSGNANAIINNSSTSLTAAMSSSSINNMNSNAMSGPMVEIINGQIVVKESSLVLNATNPQIYEDYEEVIEDNYPTATYSSFLKRVPSPAWGVEETRLFYQAVRQCGLEFTMMQIAFFPKRTRKQLKMKFFKEEKSHPEIMDRALHTSLPLELSLFDDSIGNFGSTRENVRSKKRRIVVATSTTDDDGDDDDDKVEDSSNSNKNNITDGEHNNDDNNNNNNNDDTVINNGTNTTNENNDNDSGNIIHDTNSE